MRARLSLNLPARVVAVYVVVYYGGLVGLFPYASQWIVGAPAPVPMPEAALDMYQALLLAGLAVYVASSAQRRDAFMAPLYRFFAPPRSGVHAALRWAVLAALPLAAAGAYFANNLPHLGGPATVRIQHPAMPQRFEGRRSPLRHAESRELAAYREESQAEGREALPPDEARRRLLAQRTHQGAVLYAINCRPCHGMQANGRGPEARGLRLKPADFTDPGLLPTVVEAYAFWRVTAGGRGLPDASTPWDSAMPSWQDDLSETERWQVLLGEYDLAGVEPRQPERSE